MNELKPLQMMQVTVGTLSLLRLLKGSKNRPCGFAYFDHVPDGTKVRNGKAIRNGSELKVGQPIEGPKTLGLEPAHLDALINLTLNPI